MDKITAIVIAKNEEKNIRGCIESLDFCDEVILIDNDSSDKTVEIAKKYNSKVYSIKTDDFSKLRNFGAEKANSAWLLYLDADERISYKLQEEIQEILISGASLVAYKLPRQNYYLGNNLWPKIEKMERLIRKDSLRRWQGKLHESPVINGKIGECQNYILHYTHQNLSEMVEKTNQWSDIEAISRYNLNHPEMTSLRFIKLMFSVFFDYFVKQKGYKVKTAGMVESIYQSFSIFITYAKLWELQQIHKNDS